MTAEPMPMKHDSPESRGIVDTNTILRVRVGSHLYGTAIPGVSDQDVLALVIEPPAYVIGLGEVDDQGRLRQYEQYEYHTQPDSARNGPFDVDFTAYSLRKWCRLAAGGRTDALLPVFAAGENILEMAWPGKDLHARRDLFISAYTANRYIDYLKQKHATLVKKPDFDTKAGMHAVRLGLQGVELLSTGRITLPVPDNVRKYLLNIRGGRVIKDEVLERIEWLREELLDLRETTSLPERADYRAINRWLSDVYQTWWRQRGY